MSDIFSDGIVHQLVLLVESYQQNNRRDYIRKLPPIVHPPSFQNNLFIQVANIWNFQKAMK